MLLNDFKKRIKIILGSLDNVKCGPYDIFDETIIEFLNQISKEILKNRKIKKHTDVVSFGFLALHLLHGFSSSFQSLGANNKYTRAIKGFTTAFAVGIPLGFVFIALFHHLTAF